MSAKAMPFAASLLLAALAPRLCKKAREKQSSQRQLTSPGNEGLRAQYIPLREYMGYLIPSFPTKNQPELA